MYVCAHTPVTLCTIEGIGKEIKEEKKLYCSSQDVAEPSLSFLIVNVLSVGKEVWFSFSRLLLSAAGKRQLYLHPPFPTALKNTERQLKI